MLWSGNQDAQGFQLTNFRNEQAAALPAYTSPTDAGRKIFVTTVGATYGLWIGNEQVAGWVRATGMWEEIAHVLVAGAAAQNIDIPCSIGLTGLYKRYKMYLNILNSSGGAISVYLYFNTDYTNGNYDYAVQAASGNTPHIVANNAIANGKEFAWVLEEGQMDAINTDFWTSGRYYTRDINAPNQTVQHRWRNGATDPNVTEIRVHATVADGLGIGSEVLLLGLVQ